MIVLSQRNARLAYESYRGRGIVKSIDTIKRGLAIAMLLSTGMAEGSEQSQNIWQFIPAARSAIKSLSIDNLDDSLLTFRLSHENEYINFYTAEPVKLADGLLIADIELRLSKRREGMSPMLVFSPYNQCVTLASIKEHYHNLNITDYPRGRSENEVTSFTTPADTNGQKISFSFTVKASDCLARVVIAGD